MKTASRTLDERDAPGDGGRRRRAARLLLVTAVILLAPASPFARPTQKQEQRPPKQIPSPQAGQRPPLKVSVTADPDTLELCPNKPASVRLSAAGLDRLAGFAIYAWKPSAGRIDGDDATVTWDLSGTKPGVHTAVVFVNFRAPSGAPLGNGQAAVRVTLRECQTVKPDPTQNTGQGTPGVGVTDPKLPENTSPPPPRTPTPRTPTPSPTASPALSPTPSPAATLTPTTPSTTSPPAPGAGPSEAAPTEPSGVRAWSYLWLALIIPLSLLTGLAALALWWFLKSPVEGGFEAAPPERTPRGSSGRQQEAHTGGGVPVWGVTEEEEVLCSVFAPHAVAPGDGFLVQAFAHLAEQAALLPGLAKEAEQRAERRGSKELGRVERGQVISFHLEAPGLEIDEPSQSIVWRGRVESAQFGVTVPESFRPRTVNCKLTVAHPKMLGHIRFSINVAAAAPPAEGDDALKLFDERVRYRQAFVSYASEDRAEVLKRVQMLKAMRVKFFQDVLSLEPGDRWEKELYRNIDRSDVFLLFWSAAAHRSEWVEKEVRYALTRKGGADETPPEIVPVILQGPPEVPPPGYLPEQHFNDPLAILIKAEEAPRRTADDA